MILHGIRGLINLFEWSWYAKVVYWYANVVLALVLVLVLVVVLEYWYELH